MGKLRLSAHSASGRPHVPTPTADSFALAGASSEAETGKRIDHAKGTAATTTLRLSAIGSSGSGTGWRGSKAQRPGLATRPPRQRRGSARKQRASRGKKRDSRTPEQGTHQQEQRRQEGEGSEGRRGEGRHRGRRPRNGRQAEGPNARWKFNPPAEDSQGQDSGTFPPTRGGWRERTPRSSLCHRRAT